MIIHVCDAVVVPGRRHKKRVGVFVPTCVNGVHPHHKIRPKRLTGRFCRTNEVSNYRVAPLRRYVAQVAHASCVFNPVFKGEPQILIDVLTDVVGVEMGAAQPFGQRRCQSGLSASGQTHDKNLHHSPDQRWPTNTIVPEEKPNLTSRRPAVRAWWRLRLQFV